VLTESASSNPVVISGTKEDNLESPDGVDQRGDDEVVKATVK
jgi:hypothetical protein